MPDDLNRPIQRVPPQNLEVEEAILGTMLQSRLARDEVLDTDVTVDDFYKPLHRTLFRAILDVTASGHAVDRAVLRARMKEDDVTLDDATIEHLARQAPILGSAKAEAAHLHRLGTARRAIMLLDRALESAWDGDVEDVLDVVHRSEELLAPPFDAVDPPIGASALAAEDHTVDWIVPGWLARHEIVLFVAEPGSGKTTLLNQTATCLASALHPWTLSDLHASVRCLVFDFQDSRGARGRGVQKMLSIAKKRYPANRGEPDTLFYELRTQGIDLTTRADQRWFEAKIVACKPDVVVAGPLYNMVSGDKGRAKHSEETAELAGQFLSELCIRRDIALLVEAHAPHGDELRVRGSKYWEDWAGWGIGLVSQIVDSRREFTIKRFRGDREADRSWPDRWVQGHEGHWPWEALGVPRSEGGHPEQQKF
jgi:replicative DNA helicase